MSVTPIASPMAGEHVVMVWPPMAEDVAAGWRRRLRLYSGRTLSDDDLRGEQDNRAGRLAALGQSVAAGIVSGLVAGLDPTPPSGGGGTGPFFVTLSPGMGLAVTGEDVIVPRPLRIAVGDLMPADAPADMRAAILVLEPVEMLELAKADPNDPCLIDESELAFSDEQRIDGALLRLLPWDPEWLGGGALDDAGAARSALAYRIFSHERQLLPTQQLPWEQVGVPLGVIGFKNGAPVYLDRFAVRRSGGQPRRRTPIVQVPSQRAGGPRLWQAMIQQLGEQIAELAAAGLAPASRAASLSFLPPAGLVPLDSVDVRAAKNAFFPPAVSVRMAPLPLEQLDGVIARSASMAPIPLDGSAQSLLLVVPVPQAVYEPRLLVDEVLSPEFDDAIATFVAQRTDWLGRRLFVRGLLGSLDATVDGPAAVPTYPDPDPEALEDEGTILPISTDEATYDLVDDPTDTATPKRQVPQTYLGLRDEVTNLSATDAADLAAQGLSTFTSNLQAKLGSADDVVDYAFLKVHANIYRVRQVMLGASTATRLAVSPILASIAQGESAAAQTEQLNNFYLSIKGHLPLGGIQPDATATPAASTSSGTSGTGGTPLTAALMAPAPSAGSALAGTPQMTLNTAGLSFVGTSGAVPTTSFSASSGVTFTVANATAASTTSSQALLKEAAFINTRGRQVIQAADPIIGAGGYDFRTSSIAQRMNDSAATEAHSYAVAARFEMVQMLTRLTDRTLPAEQMIGLNLDAVTIFGVPTPGAYSGAQPRTNVAYKDLLSGTGGIGALLPDNGPTGAIDEGAFFLEAIRLLEYTVQTLRQVEARVAGYRQVLSDLQDGLDAITTNRDAAKSRLDVIDGQVSETRHMVATARALRADEVIRLDAINTRRHAVIDEHVRILAYVRPRSVEALVDAPTFPVDPGLLDPPIPACLSGHGAPPPELDAMVQLLREAPVSWFPDLPQALQQLDRVDLLQGTLVNAQLRARTMLAQPPGAPGGMLTFVQRAAATPLAQSLARVTGAQQAVITRTRQAAAQLDLGTFVGLGWLETRERAVKVLSLGDLIEANHGRSAVAQAAATELQQVGAVAGCFHARMSDVDPLFRLEWAERLSQYDEGVPLGSLTALPNWMELAYPDRRDLQAFADWLYGRVDANNAEALAWMHDLVRVCILLASHAPVDQIIAGSVPVTSTAAPGAALPVTIDPARVHIGMRVMFYKGEDMVAHGVVDDLVGAQARARVLETVAGGAVSIEASTRARFVEADGRFTPTFAGRAR